MDVDPIGTYQSCSTKERQVFLNWLTDNFDTSLYKIEYQFTPTAGFDVYDVYFSITSLKSHRLIDYIVEVKLRQKHYPTLMLEKQKYDSLIRKSKEMDCDILYFNQTPQGIFIFDITDMTNRKILPPTKEMTLVHHTVCPQDGTKDKEIYLLDTKHAIKY